MAARVDAADVVGGRSDFGQKTLETIALHQRSNLNRRLAR